MIPLKREARECQTAEDDKHYQRDDLLHYLQLHKAERPAIALKPYTVGRHLKTVLHQCYAPRKQDDRIQWPVGRNPCRLKLQMPIPGARHEDVRDDEEEDSSYCCVHYYMYIDCFYLFRDPASRRGAVTCILLQAHDLLLSHDGHQRLHVYVMTSTAP